MDYESVARNTTQTIRENGARLTLTRAGESSYDPATSTNIAEPVKHEGHAVRTDYATREIDGTSVLSGDVRFLLAVHDINDRPMPQPVAGNLLTFAGETWRVVISRPVSPGGVAVLWKTQARK